MPSVRPCRSPASTSTSSCLDLLPRAAAVALLAAPQVGVDRVAVEDEPGRQPGDDRDERRPVRLAGGRRATSVTAAERTAFRITSTGAGTPVQSSNDAAPWRDEHLEPVDHRRAGRARRRAPSRVSRVRQVDERLALAQLDEHLVAHRRRVDDEVGSRATSGGQSPRRENTRALAAARAANAARGAAVADDRPAARTSSSARIAASVLVADDAPVLERRACSPTSASASSHERAAASLCGAVTFAPAKPSGREPAHRLLEPLRRDVERDVRPVEPARRERRVLHARRERVRDGMAEQRDEPRLAR